MDFERIAAEWLRLARGKLSQRGFSKRLGYRTNISYRWESGECFPTAAEAFHLAKRGGPAGRAALASFYGTAAPKQLARVDLSTPPGVARLLEHLRGKTSLVELANHSGHSRFAISRWLSGEAEPRLPSFFAIVEAMTFRLLDFLASFVDVEAMPSIADEWRVLVAARKAAYDVPWSLAVLRTLELSAYRALGKHRPGWIARRLGISASEEQRCLGALAAGRQIRMADGLWTIDQNRVLDTRADPLRARKLRAEWIRVAAGRLEGGTEGTFGYNVMALSLADFERLKELHLAYFRSMQALVTDSKTSECVVFFNTNLFALDAHESG